MATSAALAATDQAWTGSVVLRASSHGEKILRFSRLAEARNACAIGAALDSNRLASGSSAQWSTEPEWRYRGHGMQPIEPEWRHPEIPAPCAAGSSSPLEIGGAITLVARCWPESI